MGQLDLHYSPKRIRGLLGQGLLFLAFLIAILVFLKWETSSFVFLIVLTVAVLFMMASLLSKLFIRSAIITIGPDGIFDRRIMKQTIPWSAIDDLVIKKYGSGKTVNFFFGSDL